MEETGTMLSQKLSEGEFSYWWCVPEFLSGYSYQSPKFGSICDEFSDCHLEIKTHIELQQISRFFLRSPNDRNEVKFTFSASLEHGVHPKPKGIYSTGSYELKPYVKVFAMDPSQHEFHPYFILKLNLKLCKDSTDAAPFPYSNASFQDTNEKSRAYGDPSKKRTTAKDAKENGAVASGMLEGESKFAERIEQSEKLAQDLRFLYFSGIMSDLEIRFDEDESVLRAHKSILSARSPVLKRMIENIVESSSNFITITEGSAQAFEKFLIYIYTGKLENRTLEIVMFLYLVSIKYEVPALEKICSKALQEELSSKPVEDVADVACDLLKLRELVDSELKDLATNLVVNKFPIISNKQSWKELMNSNFVSTSEILALVFAKCQKIQA